MQWLGNVDDRVRGFWQQREAENMARGQKAFADEMMGRSLDSAARRMADRTGRDLGDFGQGGVDDLGGLSDSDRRQLYEQEFTQRPGVLTRATRMGGSTGPTARAGQAVGYGAAIGGGVAGIAAMTAAAQQLVALMGFLQEGQDSAVKRDQELV
jgi:hypothetical protein